MPDPLAAQAPDVSLALLECKKVQRVHSSSFIVHRSSLMFEELQLSDEELSSPAGEG
jgi:hypothetical protein